MSWFPADGALPAIGEFALPSNFFASEEEMAALAADEEEVPPETHAMPRPSIARALRR